MNHFFGRGRRFSGAWLVCHVGSAVVFRRHRHWNIETSDANIEKRLAGRDISGSFLDIARNLSDFFPDIFPGYSNISKQIPVEFPGIFAEIACSTSGKFVRTFFFRCPQKESQGFSRALCHFPELPGTFPSHHICISPKYPKTV